VCRTSDLKSILPLLSIGSQTAIRLWERDANFLDQEGYAESLDQVRKLPPMSAVNKLAVVGHFDWRSIVMHTLLAVGDISGVWLNSRRGSWGTMARTHVPLVQIDELWIDDLYYDGYSPPGADEIFLEHLHQTLQDMCALTTLSIHSPYLRRILELFAPRQHDPSTVPLCPLLSTVHIFLSRLHTRKSRPYGVGPDTPYDVGPDIASFAAIRAKMDHPLRRLQIGYYANYPGPLVDLALPSEHVEYVEAQYRFAKRTMELPPVCRTRVHGASPSWHTFSDEGYQTRTWKY